MPNPTTNQSWRFLLKEIENTLEKVQKFSITTSLESKQKLALVKAELDLKIDDFLRLSNSLELTEIRPNENPQKKEHFNIAILSVIPKELEALECVFEFKNSEPFRIINGIRFWKTSLKQEINKSSKLNILHSMIGAAGNVPSSLFTYLILQNFKVDMIILCGIAAGNKKKAKIYSSIIGDKIIYYEPQKLIFDSENKDRFDPIPVDGNRGRDIQYLTQKKSKWKEALIAILEKEKKQIPPSELKDKDWIDLTWKETLEIGEGSIVSGEKLFADKITLEKLVDENKIGKYVIAGEMESYGFAKACIENRHPDWLVIRGISDYGGPEKSDDVNDNYQIIAALSAAVLVKTYLTWIYSPTQK